MFAATRKEEYKKAAALKQKKEGDVSNETARLREMINKLAGAVRAGDMEQIIEDANKVAGDEVQEADWKIIED